MSVHLCQFRRASGLLASLLTLTLLSGCGSVGTAVSEPTALAAAPTATATEQPTATATSLPTTAVAAGACGRYFPYVAALAPARGLVVTQYSGLGNLAYPAVQIPDSQPAAPMTPPTVSGPAPWEANTTPVVDPRLEEGGGGYVIAICNTSSQTHTISAVQVTLAKMTPYTGQLNAWEPCSGDYHPVGNYTAGGCGGGDTQNEYLHAPFAANAAVGATVTATQTGSNISNVSEVNPGPLPVALKPGQAMSIEVGVTQPSAPGYYTYSFALTVDGGSTGTVAYSLMSLLAPVARAWDGAACKTSAMLALIAKEPTPTATTSYICPVA